MPNQNIRGSHLKEANSHTLGICLLSYDGLFIGDDLTPEARQTLIKLLAWKSVEQGINPDSIVAQLDGWGEKCGDYFSISGHTDFEDVDKECPGLTILGHLPDIRREVKEYIVAYCESIDSDKDFIPNRFDNCPDVPNTDQADWNFNGIGDACEDYDNDGVKDENDICPDEPDHSELDMDYDGIPDGCDNCPNSVNADQLDMDADGIGDKCDHDLDGDGIINNDDNCPNHYNPNQEDEDNNGIGDKCEMYPCDSEEAQQAMAAMQSCLSDACAALESASNQYSQIVNDCSQNAQNSSPLILNEQILRREWIKGIPGELFGCLEEFGLYNTYMEFGTSGLNDEEHEVVFLCLTDAIYTNAINNGYDPDMPEPTQQDIKAFEEEVCDCKKPAAISYGQEKTSIAKSALQCYHPTGENCSAIKSCRDKAGWNAMILNSQRTIERLENLD